VRIRETPIDLWLFGFALVLSWILDLLTWDRWIAWLQSQAHFPFEKALFEKPDVTQMIITLIMVCALLVVAFRRRRTGRL
jgi:uncharacterized membrane protein (DUF2068 family)